MLAQAFFFWIFATMLVGSALAVILARNPVHSVLFLILAFVSASGLFVLMGAEFLAMMLIVVYVGAVAVLFLFVVMMLDINLAELRRGFLRYLPIGAIIGVVLLAEILFGLGVFGTMSDTMRGFAQQTVPATMVDNTRAIGRVLYTQYFYLFQVAGMVLLVAMIGAIVLTLRRRPGVRRQKAGEQINRTKEDTIAVVKVPTRGGV